MIADPSDAQPTLGRRWDPDDALAALATRGAITDINADDPDQLRHGIAGLFREAALVTAMGVIHTAQHDPNSRVRLDAAKYVLAEATKAAEGEQDPLTTLLKDLYKHVSVSSGLPQGEG